MSFLAPWALVVGALAAASLVLLHLVARQRPAAYLLPTARFIPDRRTLVSRVARRPRDLLLLLVRVLLILSAAAAFARPVLTPHRVPSARILLIDRSSSVADPSEAVARARAVLNDAVPTTVASFDTTVTVLGIGAAALDSLRRGPSPGMDAVGSISAALVAVRRIAAVEGARADSVELVLVSPVSDAELDSAVDSVRAQWPGVIALQRVGLRVDAGRVSPLERELSRDDVLAPALDGVPVARGAHSVRVTHGAFSANDSVFARAGGAVVRWDAIGSRRLVAAAVAMGDDVVVASLARDSLAARGTTLARWADGSPAAVEESLGEGCLREIAIGVPIAGDLPLRPAFQDIVRGLFGPCAAARHIIGGAADSASIARLIGIGSMASGSALAGRAERPAPIAAWLFALAIAGALLELLVRARRREAEDA